MCVRVRVRVSPCFAWRHILHTIFRFRLATDGKRCYAVGANSVIYERWEAILISPDAGSSPDQVRALAPPRRVTAPVLLTAQTLAAVGQAFGPGRGRLRIDSREEGPLARYILV